MVFKRLHLGTVSYGTDTMDEIQNHLVNAYAQVSRPSPASVPSAAAVAGPGTCRAATRRLPRGCHSVALRTTHL